MMLLSMAVAGAVDGAAGAGGTADDVLRSV
jgi:hypothetical protein